MIIVKFKDTTGTNYHTSKSTSKNGASTRIKANTDNEGHMHSGTHTQDGAVDRSCNTSETVIPPLLLVLCHLGKG